MIYKIETNWPLETVKNQMEAKAKVLGFGILGQYDFKQILASKGFPIERNITVYELCNPAGAQNALDVLPEVSVYLPCRLSVYEEEGKTVLATIGIEDMLQAIDTDEEFKAFMLEIFHKIHALMNAW